MRTPTLMINGRGDDTIPVETRQEPMLDQLGVRDEDKKHVVLERGPLTDDQNAIARAALDWLDRHLGEVKFSRD